MGDHQKQILDKMELANITTNGLPRQCTATSKQSQQRCEKPPMRGNYVCAMHGGSATAARKAAQRRLLELSEPAITALADIMETSTNDNSRVAAANSILDRAGISKTTIIDIDTAREVLIERLLEMRAARGLTDTNDNDDDILDAELADG